MAVRRVLQIEDPTDAVVLRAKAKRITSFDQSLAGLVDDMIETMREARGVGIAAPQVGVSRRVVVIEEPAQYEEHEDGTQTQIAPAVLYVMVNPEIIKASEETHMLQEGCLSLPGRYTKVPRNKWVTIKYYDLKGREQRLRHIPAEDYKVGHIAQHELDHLDGIMFTDRMTEESKLVDYRKESESARLKRRGLLARKKRPDAELESESTTNE
ncbi:MAG TPA: peptide deformylase [Herpetosiphon sp.]|uniref:Peptide deformylase n=1 Tax=Herpetosiphon aurantiacus (strain ATCC 23779 / DSM 785 / 114-95) TaxID=316274 RepID=A9AZ24_HERA2|nr:peptide deformylase [Herpetosiphon sp.]ABX07064.1 peptide deformylase [Herpetosiphon aurantiacus DSM 785]HBW50955.1 peptide deformylase [Herpetosiphon sp.]